MFDDFNLAKWNAEDVIHVLDVSRVTSVRCRYETVRIQPWVARVFTSNVSVDMMFPRGATLEQGKAMRRRMRVVNVTECLFCQAQGSNVTVGPEV